MILEILTTLLIQAAPQPVPALQEPIHGTIKTPFKTRHPKWYHLGRKARTVCIFIKPICDVGADVVLILGKGLH